MPIIMLIPDVGGRDVTWMFMSRTSMQEVSLLVVELPELINSEYIFIIKDTMCYKYLNC